ncbi:VanW family protein [Nocardioides donggukensis]|uniref:VanW family protein n=1 Tax=Nocardioides donggukensis TaxID=2774019 RepID=A0A927K4X7_9ACTN|nr:VanW family protein [Nocardioides donggukensis]MBD8870319.1 VanW family protein [Nocardioides donggukensis]
MKTQNQRESNGGRVVVWTVLGLVVLFGAAYVAAYAFAGEKVPRGATVAGVPIGGQTHSEAAETLEAGLAERNRLDVSVDGEPVRVTAQRLGLTVDHAASVEAAGGGRSWAPGRLWDFYTGGDDLDPVLRVDEDAFAATLDELDETFGTKAREGDVGFEDGRATTTKARVGEVIDRDAARGALEQAYIDDDAAELDLVEIEPEISADDVQRALNEFANPATSGPVTLDFGKATVRLTPAEFSPFLAMRAKDGELVPQLRQKKLAGLVRSRFAGSAGAPVDATVRLVGGKPKVVPSKPGVDFDQKDINRAFLKVVAAKPGKRELAVKATVKKADFTTKDARGLKITERVSTFTTYYPHADYRNVNLGRAAELIDGTVLKPGETFSLNGIVGERTADNGFTKGFIISNGVFKEDFGGGVSQIATTTFNAMFFAGLEDVEHRPHSFYIDRYPVGREATVVWGALDLKFKNDTPYGVLVAASINPSSPSSTGSVTVSMYSTKTWDITTRTGDRFNFTEPETRRLKGEDCVENEGYRGFDINVFRYFRKPGASKLARTEKFETTYTPSDTVVCKKS